MQAQSFIDYGVASVSYIVDIMATDNSSRIELSETLLSQSYAQQIEAEDEEEGLALPDIYRDEEHGRTSFFQCTLMKSISFLYFWVNIWQFLLPPLFLFPAVLFSLSSDWQSFNTIQTVVIGLNLLYAMELNLLLLWLAVIIFPLKNVDYPDVQWIALLPNFFFFAVVYALYLCKKIGWYWEITDGFFSVSFGSYIWIVVVVGIKKFPTLKQRLFGDAKLRLLWIWMAIISLFVSYNPVESVIVTILSCSLVSFRESYPHLPIDAMPKTDEMEQERRYSIKGETDTSLQRQNAKLGGRKPLTEKLSESPRQPLLPVVMGILVSWSFAFVVGYGFGMRILANPHLIPTER